MLNKNMFAAGERRKHRNRLFDFELKGYIHITHPVSALGNILGFVSSQGPKKVFC